MKKIDRGVKKGSDDMAGSLSTTPPAYLDNDASRVWRRIVPYLKENSNVTNADKTLVEAFCINYQEMRDAYQKLRDKGALIKITETKLNPKTGAIVATDFLGYKKNPAVGIIDSATKNLKMIGNELGLSPKSRGELMQLPNAPKKEAGSVEDQMKDFFSGSK